MVKIVQQNDPVLRQKTEPVPALMIGSHDLKKIIKDMKAALAKEEDGVALAAPQIGLPLRIFIVSGRVMEMINPEKTGKSKKYPDKVFINPEIMRLSKDREILEEGCLSVRYLYGKIERAKKARVRALDEKGREFEVGASGLLAQIFQHETDHLEGKLFTDSATDLKDLPPEKAEGHRAIDKIAFFGTPHRAVTILEALKRAGLSPSLIVTQPDRPQGRKLVVTPPPVKIWAQKEGIPTLQPENLDDVGFLETLKNGDFDVFVVVAYGKILKDAVLQIPKHGCLNLHASLLPKLRGSSPIETAILQDERKTGVTIILMDNLMDHGPIVAKEEVKLEKWPMSVNELSDALLQAGGDLMAKTIPKWVEGEIKPKEQDHSQATTVKKIKKEDGLIDLSADPYKNYLKFLAFREWPTSYFYTEKEGKKTRVIITDALYENGVFSILKVIPEGKKEMSFADFQKNLLISPFPRQTS